VAGKVDPAGPTIAGGSLIESLPDGHKGRYHFDIAPIFFDDSRREQGPMADLLIRDLKPATHELLRRRAEASGRSLQAEVHSILDSATRASDVDAARELADRIAARLSDRQHPDSAELVREVRDR
jgi:plasmid stability protein